MIARLVLSALLLLCLAAMPTHAASPADVAEVISMVTDPKIPAISRTTKIVGTNKVPETTIEFVWQEKRYTIDYSDHERVRAPGFPPKKRWLTIYSIKNGSADRNLVSKVIDYDVDGTIEFGHAGSFMRKYAEPGIDNVERSGIGFEHKGHWQAEYDKSIAAAIAYKRSVTTAK